jgi:hypothetical protein
MARIKRKRLQFNEDSLNELYQEIYNDTHNFKAQITNILSRWSPMVKDEGNVAAMGKDIVNLMNAIARTNDQKIILVKILKDIVFAKKGINDSANTGDNPQQITLSDEAKRELMRMADEARKGVEDSGTE